MTPLNSPRGTLSGLDFVIPQPPNVSYLFYCHVQIQGQRSVGRVSGSFELMNRIYMPRKRPCMPPKWLHLLLVQSLLPALNKRLLI